MREQEHVIKASQLAASIPNSDGNRVQLYENVDFAVREGEAVAILGRSGSGKSTLLSTLGLMQRPQSGTLYVSQYDAAQLSEAGAARLRNELIGFVFQSYSLIPHLSVFDNVALPLRYGRRSSRKAIRGQVLESLERVGLASRATEKPLRLSGGEQQRVAIARALVRKPPIVLADEPTGALDTDTASHVLEVLRAATRQAGSCLIVVTHDQIIAKSMDHLYRLHTDGLHAHTPGSTP